MITKNDKNIVVLNASKVNFVTSNFEDMTLHHMSPGMTVETKIAAILKNGFELSFGSFSGYVNVSYLNDENLEIGQDVKATILHILPTINHIYLSLKSDKMTFGGRKIEDRQEKSIKAGDICKNVIVNEIDQRGLILNLDSNIGEFIVFFIIIRIGVHGFFQRGSLEKACSSDSRAGTDAVFLVSTTPIKLQ